MALGESLGEAAGEGEGENVTEAVGLISSGTLGDFAGGTHALKVKIRRLAPSKLRRALWLVATYRTLIPSKLSALTRSHRSLLRRQLSVEHSVETGGHSVETGGLVGWAIERPSPIVERHGLTVSGGLGSRVSTSSTTGARPPKREHQTSRSPQRQKCLNLHVAMVIFTN
jgi:hypothetical protein